MINLIDPFGLKERTDIKVLRQSYLGTADVCLKRLEFDRSKEQSHSVHTLMGTAYHAGAACWYAGVYDVQECIDAAGFVFDMEMDTYGSMIDFGDITVDEAWEKVWTALDVYLNKYTWDLNEWNVVGVEIEFWMPLFDNRYKDVPRNWHNEWAAKGTIDMVLRHAEDLHRYVVVDHKTAGKPWRASKASSRHNNQPAWYLHWWPILVTEGLGRSTPEQVEFFFDVQALSGEFKRWPAPRSKGEIYNTVRKAHDLALLFEMDAPLMPNTASSLCSPKWCRHWDDCPYGESFHTGIQLITNKEPVTA